MVDIHRNPTIVINKVVENFSKRDRRGRRLCSKYRMVRNEIEDTAASLMNNRPIHLNKKWKIMRKIRYDHQQHDKPIVSHFEKYMYLLLF